VVLRHRRIRSACAHQRVEIAAHGAVRHQALRSPRRGGASSTVASRRLRLCKRRWWSFGLGPMRYHGEAVEVRLSLPRFALAYKVSPPRCRQRLRVLIVHVSLCSKSCANIAGIKMARAVSRQLALRFRSWGGARPGAGRKSMQRRGGVRHLARPAHCARHPVHMTLRLAPGLPSLRSEVIGGLIRRAFRDTRRRWFRVVHFSIQSNHLHLLVEADDRKALSRGSAALAIRIARRLNALLGRKGTVFPERYHDRALKTPREVRNALAYVLLNAHRHNVELSGVDIYSSGITFDGWRGVPTRGRAPPHGHQRSAEPASTWLLARGWRRHGLIGSWERPGGQLGS
jgi:REP element-mobilizing transposase RayT